ncbi:RHOMBOID-like protein 1 [Zingiber officinale]|uniref:RHOMBOID-like protein 1 n=1 Tax=Zingiber officinale TaxID=94328 RepID=UPI001C4C77E7|nr:RHOMBOID-like protein 1 [Zingiber officinale]
MGKEPAASQFEVKIQMRPGDFEHSWASSPVPPPQLSDQRRSLPADSLPFRRWTPWLAPTIVLANIAVFGVIMYVNDCPENTPGLCVGLFLGRFAFQSIKENPLLGPSSFTLKKMGALDVQKVVQEHQGWRLLVCIWLHAGLVHVLANMLSLILIGIRLELPSRRGPKR